MNMNMKSKYNAIREKTGTYHLELLCACASPPTANFEPSQPAWEMSASTGFSFFRGAGPAELLALRSSPGSFLCNTSIEMQFGTVPRSKPVNTRSNTSRSSGEMPSILASIASITGFRFSSAAVFADLTINSVMTESEGVNTILEKESLFIECAYCPLLLHPGV